MFHQQNAQCEEKSGGGGGFFSKWSQNFGKKELSTTNETTEATATITTEAQKRSWSFPKLNIFSKNETKKTEDKKTEEKKPEEKAEEKKVEEKKGGWFSGIAKPKVSEGQKEETPRKEDAPRKDEAAKKESGWFSSLKGKF